MTMTRTVLPIRFVLILATVIGIHGGADTPREATMAVSSNFEDGLSDREFRVEFAGFKGSSATIKIFRKEDEKKDVPRVEYEIKEELEKARTLYFQLNENEAPAGVYQVQVCAGEKCSAKRIALGRVLDENKKPALTCIKGTGQEEDLFHEFLNNEKTEFEFKIKPGKSFLAASDLATYVPKSMAKLGLTSNPAYVKVDKKNVFYAAVFYDATHLKDLLDTAVDDATQRAYLLKEYGVSRKTSAELHTHGYCSRKYIFWASIHVMKQGEKIVLRRYRGTIAPNEVIVNRYILKPNAGLIPVEFAQYDDKQLSPGIYDVSVSFCVTDKDVIDSSVCSKATTSTLTVV